MNVTPTRLDAPLPYPRRDWALLRDRAITLRLRLKDSDPRRAIASTMVSVLDSVQRFAPNYPHLSAQLWTSAGELACRLAGRWNG